MGKAFESIMAIKLGHLTEQKQLTPNTQTGGRRGKPTETAQELLMEQIHIVWEQGKYK